ncbi:LysM peptidoglycan-binding domain-containing protein [Viridibacillus sp. YIM B01967]|uniref:LysM peptidoglycan-binding domain-containing protein n=1 Tax=Viridibacillus soli TaxID=2798301 RepID=A0ABS1HD03_9BACL|nr:glycosyl hydrolase family 18 protein [Viridibacillus soli]MBK3497315.1 LysM peptidoglycan-binding domain-containing protein [Viridibacillus soli]
MIYVVKQGDSVYDIARTHHTTAATIVALNELPDPDVLVIGQALVLPETPNPNRPTIDTNGYIEWYTEELPESLIAQVRRRAPLLTYMMPFSYEVRRDGTLTPLEWGSIPEIANASQSATAIVLTNIENHGFSDTLAHAILTDITLQDLIIGAALREASAKEAKDIHLDFEYLKAEDRDRYVAFLNRFRARAHAQGLTISAAVPPKTSANQPGKWYEGHDYKGIGEAVDFVIIMTYEWGYSGGPPMAVSPIGPVRQVLEYSVSEIPANKVMMGQNLYGYDWTLPYAPGNPPARGLSPQQAIALAKNQNAAISYDSVAEAPFFHYWRNGVEHVVWFEDARSIEAKFNLLKELKLKGISYWHMGFAFPQNWALLREMFHVKKR